MNNKKFLHLSLVVFATIFFFVPSGHPVNASGLYCGVNANPLKPFTCQVAPELTGNRSDCANATEGDACVPIDRAGRVATGLVPSTDTMACFVGATAGTLLGNPTALIAGGVCVTAKIVASLMGPVASVFDALVNFNNKIFAVAFIQTLWTMVRNFVNLLFILIMIVIAFATIFDIQKYDWRRLLVRLIIVALLVNFSFLIVQTVSNLSDRVSTNILSQINSIQSQDGKPHTISEWLAAGFNPQKFEVANQTWLKSLTDAAAKSISVALGISIPKNTVEVIFLGLMLLTLITLIIMYLLRIFVLWGLAIAAPAAFVAAILPSTRAHFESWKKHLIAWTLFSPLYLLVLAVTIGFATHRTDILNSMGIPPDDSSFFLGILGLGDIIFYALTLAILWFGLAAVRKVGTFANTGVNTAFDAIQGKVKRVTGISATQTALVATKNRFLDEGLPGRANVLYGGKRGEERRAEGIANILQKALGYEPLKSVELKMKRAKEEEAKIKKQLDAMTTKEGSEYLKAKWENGTESEKLAAGRMRNSKKELSAIDQMKLYDMHGGDSSEAARQLAKKDIDFVAPNWTAELRKAFFEQVQDAEVKKAVLNAQAKEGDLREKTADALKQLTTFFASPKDKLEFLENVQTKKNPNPEAAFQAKYTLGFIKDQNGITITDDITKAREADKRRLKKRRRTEEQINITREGMKDYAGTKDGGKSNREERPPEAPKPPKT